MSGTPGRQASFDIVRGLSMVSMVLAHLSGAGFLYSLFHAHPGYDGASGFVLLSGLVLGIVQRKRLENGGVAGLRRRSLRRMGKLYLAHLAIAVLALAVAGTSAAELATAVLPVLTLQLAPSIGSILRMYVVFLLLAVCAYGLLARRRPWIVLAGSLALYGLSAALPLPYTSFYTAPGEAETFSWAGWQLLFVSALVLGWHGNELDLTGRLHRHRWAVLGAATALLLAGAVADRWIPAWFAKSWFAPGRVVMAYAGVAALVALTELLRSRVPTWVFRPVELIGRHSLDAYVLQAWIGLVVLAGVGWPRSTPLAVATLAVCWGWAEFREARRRRAQPRPDPLADGEGAGPS